MARSHFRSEALRFLPPLFQLSSLLLALLLDEVLELVFFELLELELDDELELEFDDAEIAADGAVGHAKAQDRFEPAIADLGGRADAVLDNGGKDDRSAKRPDAVDCGLGR